MKWKPGFDKRVVLFIAGQTVEFFLRAFFARNTASALGPGGMG